jgi:hypothetical protein
MVAVAAVLVSVVALAGCGGGAASAPPSASEAAASAAPGAAGGSGVALCTEILTTFDAMVAEVAEAAKAKPAPAELTPALEAIYTDYTATMTELNGRYRALKDADIAEYGACNTYLGNERGKHVLAKDQTLTEAVQYYNLQLGDAAMVALLSTRPVELLDIAVKQD